MTTPDAGAPRSNTDNRGRPRQNDAIYERVANGPDSWTGQANTLLKCAALLHDFQRAWPVAISQMTWVRLMLRGYAMENLLKAVIAQEGHKFAVDGRYRRPRGPDGRVVRDHDLVRLARCVQEPLTLTPRHDLMLGSLSNAVLHLGRYPIPIRVSDWVFHDADNPVENASCWCEGYERLFWETVTQLATMNEVWQDLSRQAGVSQVEWLLERSWRQWDPTRPA
jgi:hypothetical protein